MKKYFIILGTFFLAFYTSVFAQTNPAAGYSVNLYPTNISCFGDSSGSVTANVVNGIGPFTYSWSNGVTTNSSSSTNTISNLKAGLYNVNVTDWGSGLTTFGMTTITQPQPINISLTGTDVLCKGGNSGDVQLQVSGGTGPFNYQWSNGKFTKNNDNLTAGKYVVTVSESSTPSCLVKDSITIEEPVFALNYSFTTKNVNCYNGSDASIDLTVNGGTPPYDYSWNSGQYQTEDIKDISAGTYSFVAYDANNCQVSDVVTINQPTALQNNLNGKDAKCFSSADGEVTNTVSGGTKPYSYEWWNSDYKMSAKTQNLTNVRASNYRVKITDANGCTTEDSFEVKAPEQLKTTIAGTDITSFGGTDGAIDLNVSGGVKPYSYIWSNNESTEDQANIPAGKYLVEVIDFNNCNIKDSIVLNQPASSLTMQYNSKNVTCFGGNDGWIEVYANGGTPPYKYYWDNGDTIPKIYDLVAGKYAIRIVDNFGISISDSITITEQTPVQATASTIDNKCFGEKKGEIDITVNGGAKPYTYEWRNSDYILSARTEDIQNLAADFYTVTIFDTNDCQVSYTYEIKEPTALEVSTSTTVTPCFGGPNGSVDLTVSGGVKPYNFDWSSGDITEDIPNAYPGRHTVIVTDANGCTIETSDSVGKMDTISFDHIAFEITCKGRKNGEAMIHNISGGNGHYSLLWSNGDTNSHITDLDKGEVEITVTDFLGCTAKRKITIEENEIECINVPNAFTPNGDGMNDTWVLRNIDLYPNSLIKVFNRWGNIVFESKIGYPEEWDGTYNGEPLPTGTYYYIFDLGDNSAPRNGMITIVR
jgi:gliding motility-associated-like protein